MDIIEQLTGTEFDGCVTLQNGEHFFRYDTEDLNPKESWEAFCEISNLLRDRGLVLLDSQSEHDCVTGSIFDIDWLRIWTTVREIERENNKGVK